MDQRSRGAAYIVRRWTKLIYGSESGPVRGLCTIVIVIDWEGSVGRYEVVCLSVSCWIDGLMELRLYYCVCIREAEILYLMLYVNRRDGPRDTGESLLCHDPSRGDESFSERRGDIERSFAKYLSSLLQD